MRHKWSRKSPLLRNSALTSPRLSLSTKYETIRKSFLGVDTMPVFPSDHVSLVTGSSSGIGAAAAATLAERGSWVAVHYHCNERGAQRVVDHITTRGGRAFPLCADLAKADAAKSLVDAVLSRCQRLDLLVNNAGSIMNRFKLLEITDQFWNEVMETNLGSVLRTTRAAAPAMMEQRSGAIVNVASVAARNGGSLGIIPYASAKAAVLCMTKGLAKELIPYGIRVNAVNPGVIDTPFHERFTSPAQMESMVSGIPQGRAGRASEIASVIAFLASQDATHIVGETIEVNGGMRME